MFVVHAQVYGGSTRHYSTQLRCLRRLERTCENRSIDVETRIFLRHRDEIERNSNQHKMPTIKMPRNSSTEHI